MLNKTVITYCSYGAKSLRTSVTINILSLRDQYQINLIRRFLIKLALQGTGTLHYKQGLFDIIPNCLDNAFTTL